MIVDVPAVLASAGEPGAALPHLSEIVVGLVAFSILVYIVGTRFWPRFVQSHEDDQNRIRRGIEQADSAQEDARAELERNRAKLAGVDDEAARIRDDARADAEHIKDDMARRTDEEAERIRNQGRQSLDASRSRSVSILRADVGARSVELARRIVEASLSDDASKGQSVDRFLDELEGMGGGSANGSQGPASQSPASQDRERTGSTSVGSTSAASTTAGSSAARPSTTGSPSSPFGGAPIEPNGDNR